MEINRTTTSVLSNRSNDNQVIHVAKNQDSVGSKQMTSNYDVHNMSPDELRKLAEELHESGQISERDRMMIDMEVYVMTDFGRASNDTKIDMVNRFDKMLSYEKKQPEPNASNIISLERSLDILHAVESMSNITFPVCV